MDELQGKRVIAILNKADLPRKLEPIQKPEIQISLSCRTNEGIDDLKRAIADEVNKGTVSSREHAWAVNQRHKTALEQTKISLQKALESMTANLSPEFTALDLRAALDSLGLIIGATYTEDILERIFSDFCIGK